jgi:hypothetical protein
MIILSYLNIRSPFLPLYKGNFPTIYYSSLYYYLGTTIIYFPTSIYKGNFPTQFFTILLLGHYDNILSYLNIRAPFYLYILFFTILLLGHYDNILSYLYKGTFLPLYKGTFPTSVYYSSLYYYLGTMVIYFPT